MVIGIYPRKSVYRDNSDSVSTQVKLCKDYCKILFSGQSLTFIVYGKDEGFSGKNTNRPSFKELMRDVCSDKLDVVVVYKLDRISRNVQEFSEMYNTMQEHNVSFVSVKESFDTSTPMGRTVMYILAAFAQLERENTSERVSDGMQALGEAGAWTGGKLPSGMTSIRKNITGKEHSYLQIDDKKIGLPKFLYQMFLNGYSITAVERYCRDHNITSQSGKFLNTSQIHVILTNPVYCQNSLEAYFYFKELGASVADKQLFDGKHGLIGYGRTDGNRHILLPTNKWTISVGIHDWVISSSDWIAVQNRLGENKQVRTPKYEIGILKGVISCKCGRKMHTRINVKNKIVFPYYICQIRTRNGDSYCNQMPVRIDTIDDLFLKKLREIQLDPASVQLKTPVEISDVDSLKKDIRSTERALENLTEQLKENISSTAAKYIIAEIETLDDKLNTLNSRLRSEEHRLISAKTEQEEREEIYRNICYLLEHFDELSYKEKNELVKHTVKTCVLNGNELDITF